MYLGSIRKLIFMLILCAHAIAYAAEQKFVNITIQGVSCPFCINMLTKKLSELPNVEEVRISTDGQRLLIVISPDKNSDLPAIADMIQKSGFKSLLTTESSSKAESAQPKIEPGPHIAVENKPCNTCHK